MKQPEDMNENKNEVGPYPIRPSPAPSLQQYRRPPYNFITIHFEADYGMFVWTVEVDE